MYNIFHQQGTNDEWTASTTFCSNDEIQLNIL